jgi:hypothetical protein
MEINSFFGKVSARYIGATGAYIANLQGNLRGALPGLGGEQNGMAIYELVPASAIGKVSLVRLRVQPLFPVTWDGTELVPTPGLTVHWAVINGDATTAAGDGTTANPEPFAPFQVAAQIDLAAVRTTIENLAGNSLRNVLWEASSTDNSEAEPQAWEEGMLVSEPGTPMQLVMLSPTNLGILSTEDDYYACDIAIGAVTKSIVRQVGANTASQQGLPASTS